MNKRHLETTALGISVVILGLALWFWLGQIADVRAMLEMANG